MNENDGWEVIESFFDMKECIREVRVRVYFIASRPHEFNTASTTIQPKRKASTPSPSAVKTPQMLHMT